MEDFGTRKSIALRLINYLCFNIDDEIGLHSNISQIVQDSIGFWTWDCTNKYLNILKSPSYVSHLTNNEKFFTIFCQLRDSNGNKITITRLLISFHWFIDYLCFF